MKPSASTKRASSAATATRFSASSGISPIGSARSWKPTPTDVSWRILSRVAMLGELSGALAHELSQPLTAVLSNAQAARHLLESRSAGRRAASGDARRHHQERQAGRRRDRSPARPVAEGRRGAAAGRRQRGGPRSARPGIRRDHVAPHYRDERTPAGDSARAGRSGATAASGAQSRAERVRCDEQHAVGRAEACALDDDRRGLRAAHRVGQAAGNSRRTSSSGCSNRS